MPERVRCAWAGQDPVDVAYHDAEWGVPEHDDATLFELLLLEGAQAGLSWATILRKREGYRRAYEGFDASRIARWDARKKARLLQDEGIVRNRRKIDAAVTNATAYLTLQREHGSFDAWLWRFVGGKPIQGHRRRKSDVPAKTAISDALSTELRRRGFKFVGSTICYAYMQAVGLVNDHTTDCFRQRRVARLL